MRLSRPLLVGLIALAALLVPARSEAAEVRLGVGGHYWLENGGLFDLNLAVDVPVVGPLAVGGRFGALLATGGGGTTLGVPVDLLLRLRLGRTGLYLEGTAGPWIMLSGETFRGHGGFGFGLQTGRLNVGLEVGVLGTNPLLGLRLGFKL